MQHANEVTSMTNIINDEQEALLLQRNRATRYVS